MMMPSRPMAPCAVRQACLALAALQALCKTMFRFGHTCQRCQRCLGRPMGEIKVDGSVLKVENTTVDFYLSHGADGSVLKVELTASTRKRPLFKTGLCGLPCRAYLHF